MKLKPLNKVNDRKTVKKFAFLPVTLDNGQRILWESFLVDYVYRAIGDGFYGFHFYWDKIKTYQL